MFYMYGVVCMCAICMGSYVCMLYVWGHTLMYRGMCVLYVWVHMYAICRDIHMQYIGTYVCNV